MDRSGQLTQAPFVHFASSFFSPKKSHPFKGLRTRKTNGWNPKNGGLVSDAFPFQFGWIFRFHVHFQGCNQLIWWKSLKDLEKILAGWCSTISFADLLGPLRIGKNYHPGSSFAHHHTKLLQFHPVFFPEARKTSPTYQRKVYVSI